MKLDRNLVDRIKSNFQTLSSQELQDIHAKRDTGQWSEEAFEAAKQLLDERELGTAIEPGVLSKDDCFWQDRKNVVARDSTAFPPRCVICNQSDPTGVFAIQNSFNPELSRQCSICVSHLRFSKFAGPFHQSCLLIGVVSIVSLYFILFDPPGGWRTILGIVTAALIWGGLGAFAWKYLSPNMRKGGSILIQLKVIQLGCVAFPFLVMGAILGLCLLVKGLIEGYYLLVFLSTVPPLAGMIFSKLYLLRLFISNSQPGFMVVIGTGTRFRSNLPIWPGYPRTSAVTTPGGVGKRIYH